MKQDNNSNNVDSNSIVRIKDDDIVSTNDKEGLLRKRSGRMHRWSHRYFILNGPQLSYKIKKDSDKTRGSFDLVPGCIVTEVLEESIGAIKGKKIFAFWVVWPHDKREKEKQEKKKKKRKDFDDKSDNDDESDDDDDDDDDNNNNDEEGKAVEAIAIPIKDTKSKGNKDDDKNDQKSKPKDLKHIVETEVMTVRQQQKQVEEQLERHHAHDKNVSLGVKVAAVAVGGVVIGALTAGIGLIPYITVVGITAVVGGGAVLAVRKPSDSRLILAAETMWDALAWKNAIEMEIQRLEENRKPILPSSTDPNIISFLMGTSINSQTWKKVCLVEGMRIMQQQSPMEDTICRRSQLIITMPPVTAFLAIMEGNCWPKNGSVKVVKVIDDHADIIEITTNATYIRGKYFGKLLMPSRTIHFNRFWKLDDDGIYLIALTSCDYKNYDYKNDMNNDISNNSTNSNDNATTTTTTTTKDKVKEFDPAITAVLTVSPRRDHAEYYDDLSISLVSCTCQLSSTTSWKKGELDHFINQLLVENLLELQQLLMTNKYAIDDTSNRGTEVPIVLPNAEVAVTKINNNKKAKIATVQPGLEEMGMTKSVVDKAASSMSAVIDKGMSASLDTKKQPEQEQLKKRRLFRTSFSSTSAPAAATATATPTKAVSDDESKAKPSTGKKRFLFRSSSAKSEPAASEDNGKTNAVVTDAKPLSTLSRVIGRKRGKVNTEASVLRGQIAAKEYEIQRLERLKRKDASNELNVNLLQQQAELDSLKKNYLTASGEHYEQSRRVSIRNFIGSSEKKETKVAPLPSNAMKGLMSPSKDNDSAIETVNKKVDVKSKDLDDSVYYRPLHWQPEKNDPDAASLRINDTFTSADARVNIVMVLMFSLSMIATMLLANILSQF